MPGIFIEMRDEELIVKIRNGSSDLYAEIIRRYEPKLLRYIRRFTSNSGETEDIIQESLIKAYRNLHNFDAARSFSSWIYRIAHNEAINHLKKARREPLILDEWEWEIADERLELDLHIDQKDAIERVRRALRTIKEKYREPLLLYFFESKSYEEISDILHVPRNTVGTLIARGKTRLKDILSEDQYGKK